jgi:hypothetical protein
MNRTNLIIVIFIFGILTFCSEPKNYIIETNIQSLKVDSTKAQTVDESQKASNDFFIRVLKNTIDKSIPPTIIISSKGDKIDLIDILKKETIIISSDIYCGFGLEGLTNDFPKAIKQLDKESRNFDIVCLLKRTQLDLENPEKFNKTLKELKSYFQAIYIIEEIDALKLNLFANPTRLYVNKNQIVTNVGLGISTIESLLNEIKLNTVANRLASPTPVN